MPTEAPIASSTPVFANCQDLPYNYGQSMLFQYGSTLYHLCGHSPSVAEFAVFKSIDFGNTWTCPGVGTLNGALGTFGAVAIGTTIYVWTSVTTNLTSTALWAYNVLTDTLATVSTTGTVTSPVDLLAMRLAGPDANHLFAVNDAAFNNVIVINEYLSGVATSIGVNTDLTTTYSELQGVFYGASGILHIFYTASQSSGAFPELRYFNVIGGALSTPITVLTGFSDVMFNLDTCTISQMVQIAGSIYFTFYLPSATEIQICSFTDVATPTFAFQTVVSPWTITPDTSTRGTGVFTTQLLSLFGAALICFFTNSNYILRDGGASADGWLYSSTSLNLGVTWSPPQQIIQHLDTSTFLPTGIYAPDAISSIDSTFPFNPLFASYMQVGGALPNLRFVPVCPSPTPPPPTVTGGWTSAIE